MATTSEYQCIVPTCKQKYSRGSDISFHNLPTDKKIRGEWLNNIQVKDINAYDFPKVCSKHFDKNCFIVGDGMLKKKHLIESAIPTIFEPEKKSKRKQTFDPIVVIEKLDTPNIVKSKKKKAVDSGGDKSAASKDRDEMYDVATDSEGVQKGDDDDDDDSDFDVNVFLKLKQENDENDSELENKQKTRKPRKKAVTPVTTLNRVKRTRGRPPKNQKAVSNKNNSGDLQNELNEVVEDFENEEPVVTPIKKKPGRPRKVLLDDPECEDKLSKLLEEIEKGGFGKPPVPKNRVDCRRRKILALTSESESDDDDNNDDTVNESQSLTKGRFRKIYVSDEEQSGVHLAVADTTAKSGNEGVEGEQQPNLFNFDDVGSSSESEKNYEQIDNPDLCLETKNNNVELQAFNERLKKMVKVYRTKRMRYRNNVKKLKNIVRQLVAIKSVPFRCIPTHKEFVQNPRNLLDLDETELSDYME